MIAGHHRYQLVTTPGTRMALILAIGLILGILAGWLQVLVPYIGPGIVIATVFGPLALILPTEWKVVSLLTLLFGSRLLQLIGLPSLVNFLFYGVFILLALEVLFARRSMSKLAHIVLIACALFGVSIVISGVVGEWHAFRPVLVWLTFAAPFLVLAVLIDANEHQLNVMRLAVIVIGVVQIPLAVIQFLEHGAGDYVQGTLINQGAGHHILGAAGVLASVILIRSDFGLSKAITYPLAASMLCLGLLSDAKQVYAALVVGSVPLCIYVLRRRPFYLPVVIAAGLALISIAVAINPAFRLALQPDTIRFNLERKFQYLPIVADQMDTGARLFGLGPGVGASRVAQSTLPGYGSVPEIVIGGTVSELSSTLTDAYSSYWGTLIGSSTDSPFFSVLGIYTDLGIFGVLTYSLLLWSSWRFVSNLPQLDRAIGQSLILMAVLLGLLFAWLDEPAYMSLLFVTLACLPRTSTRHNAEIRGTADTAQDATGARMVHSVKP